MIDGSKGVDLEEHVGICVADLHAKIEKRPNHPQRKGYAQGSERAYVAICQPLCLMRHSSQRELRFREVAVICAASETPKKRRLDDSATELMLLT